LAQVKAHRIVLQPTQVELTAPEGTPLQDLLFEQGVEFPCGGRGRCRGCRMGDDPKVWVVTRNCQLHDVDNIFVADGSVLPKLGGLNPSLTMQANAFRVSAYIINEWKWGAFRTPT
jgi:choline dehydrogenase-like flavoprotein